MTAETITINRLRGLKACEDTLEFLSNRFGDTVEITEENAIACAGDISWHWASENLLDENQRCVYNDFQDPYWKAYDEACEQYGVAYKKACDDAYDPLWEAYLEACAPHRKVYLEACAPYWKAYREACARAFVTAYYTK